MLQSLLPPLSLTRGKVSDAFKVQRLPNIKVPDLSDKCNSQFTIYFIVLRNSKR